MFRCVGGTAEVAAVFLTDSVKRFIICMVGMKATKVKVLFILCQRHVFVWGSEDGLKVQAVCLHPGFVL